MNKIASIIMVVLSTILLSACSPVDWYYQHILQPASTTLHNIGSDIKSTLGAAKTLYQTKVLNPFNDYSVEALGGTLVLANGAVVSYGALPLCPLGQPPSLSEVNAAGKLCHDAGVLKKMHAVQVQVVEPAWIDISSYQATHPQGSIIFGEGLAKFKEAQAALSTLTTLTNAYYAATK